MSDEELIARLHLPWPKDANVGEVTLPTWVLALTAEAADRIEELEAKLAEAVEENLETIDTLDAWFDRRKLAHDAVDQAVVDAASGYLRTSRGGGMPQEESDLVLGVIQDMARLSVFADLFARATLTELKGHEDAVLHGD